MLMHQTGRAIQYQSMKSTAKKTQGRFIGSQEDYEGFQGRFTGSSDDLGDFGVVSGNLRRSFIRTQRRFMGSSVSRSFQEVFRGLRGSHGILGDLRGLRGILEGLERIQYGDTVISRCLRGSQGRFSGISGGLMTS